MSKIEQLIKEKCPTGVKYTKLKDLVDYLQPTKYIVKDTKYNDKYNTPVLTAGQTFILGYTNEEVGIYKADKNNPVIIFDDFTTSNHWIDFQFKVKSSAMKILIPKTQDIFKYIYYCIQNIKYIPKEHSRQWIQTFSEFKIPLPPIDIQEEIVKILDKFSKLEEELEEELEKELKARRKQYEFWCKQLLHKQNDHITIKKMYEIANFKNGKGHEKAINSIGPYIVVNSKFISTNGNVIKKSSQQLVPLHKDDVLIVMSDLPNGKALAKTFIVDADNKYTLNQRIGCLTLKKSEKILPKYFYYILNRNSQLLKYDDGTSQTNLRKNDILNINLHIPSLEEQERIVKTLDKFDKLINDISEGIPAEIEARRKQYEYYRNKLLSFEELKTND